MTNSEKMVQELMEMPAKAFCNTIYPPYQIEEAIARG